MAQQSCSGTQRVSSSFPCERLQVRQELEDTPMNQINVREELAGEEESGSGCWQEDLLDLLEDQNNLLYDILGAINALVAAQLARGQSGT